MTELKREYFKQLEMRYFNADISRQDKVFTKDFVCTVRSVNLDILQIIP